MTRSEDGDGGGKTGCRRWTTTCRLIPNLAPSPQLPRASEGLRGPPRASEGLRGPQRLAAPTTSTAAEIQEPPAMM
eukprot:1127642-Alexandrium_andersonii.AAC.2